MNLLGWGLRPEFGIKLEEDEILARVIEEQKTIYFLASEKGILKAQLAGKLLHPTVDRLERPIVGDWVIAKPLWQENKAIIHSTLPRLSLLKRKAAGETQAIQPLAANVDMVFIVSSLNRDFNPKRIDRYLTIAHSSGAKAVVLLTKSDLEDNAESMAKEMEKRVKVPCIALSAFSEIGRERLNLLLQPKSTVVFVGSSGVGKSTLVNQLLGREEQSVADIREDDDRGRHTTTSRKLIPMNNGCLLIDTPGMREIQLDGDQGDGLESSFQEIEEIAKNCKFHNCKHDSEPGCKVKEAVVAGIVSEEILESFQKIQKEISFQERKQNKALQSEEKKKWKSISKNAKKNLKLKGR
jgi:ribosome biogenesis GTPase / thiamine phosphate phosphatase